MTETQNRYLGCVESFDDEKGIGLIRSGSGLATSVHYSHIEDPGFKTLKPFEIVSFAVTRAPGGHPQAYAVRVEDRGFSWP